MISIICPTRGRPQLFKQMVNSARNTAQGELEIIVGIGSDHEDDAENHCGYDVSGTKCVHTYYASAVAVVNLLTEFATADIVIVVPDDVIFLTPGWDTALQEAYNNLSNKVHIFTLQDSRNEALHLAVTKEYIAAMGYFWTPIFLHWFVDTWLYNSAKELGCHTHLRDYIAMHSKPSAGDRPVDETHIRTRKMGWHARDTYVNDQCRHFYEAEKQKLRAFL